MARKDTPKRDEQGRLFIARNPKANWQYELLERLEAGLELRGSEVKSLRENGATLQEAYARFRGDELFLVKCHIPEYRHGAYANHDPLRPRKLLLHGRELTRLRQQMEQKGLTLVPVGLYFNARGLAKLELALARGKKLFDKRESTKKRQAKREMDRAQRRRR